MYMAGFEIPANRNPDSKNQNLDPDPTFGQLAFTSDIASF